MHWPGARTLRGLLDGALARPAEELWRHSGIGRFFRPPYVPGPAMAGVPPAGLAPGEWARMQRDLGERGRHFFSDNLVSNESSYLQPAAALARLPRALAYVGVGPEQTFSYLALLEPALAFVVDVRRDNLRLHSLYRALFEEAESRCEWLALLLGRRYDAAVDPGEEAPLAHVLAALEELPPTEVAYRAAHARLVGRLEATPPPLSRADRHRLDWLHRSFVRYQLGIAFRLRAPGKQRYPSLCDMLLARGPDGTGSFLATGHAYAVVRRLERQRRVVPVVGSLAGSRALPAIAAELDRRGLAVGLVYCSNVEQYLFEQGRWHRWLENLAALPRMPQALVLRAYLDQGRPHPLQLPGHRMTSIVQSVDALLARDRRRRYGSYWEVVTDAALRPGAAAAVAG
jgi:hypothetical protein